MNLYNCAVGFPVFSSCLCYFLFILKGFTSLNYVHLYTIYSSISTSQTGNNLSRLFPSSSYLGDELVFVSLRSAATNTDFLGPGEIGYCTSVGLFVLKTMEKLVQVHHKLHYSDLQCGFSQPTP